MRQHYVDIPEGRTNSFLVHGTFLVLLALWLFYWQWLAALVVLLVAVLLFLVRTGVEVDVQGGRGRDYKASGPLRSGTWVRVGDNIHVDIRYARDAYYSRNLLVATPHESRMFEVYLYDRQGNARLFHEFGSHAQARQFAALLMEHWALGVTVQLVERRRQAQEQRRQHAAAQAEGGRNRRR